MIVGSTKRVGIFLLIMVVAIFNFVIAQKLQAYFPGSYTTSLVVPWLGIILLIALMSHGQSGLVFQTKKIQINAKAIGWHTAIILVGLVLFVVAGIGRFFQNVHPVLFFLWVPIIEKLLFRGIIFGVLSRHAWYPILGSSALFALHHLQYAHFNIAPFIIFQVAYTFFLGLLLGTIRQKSGSIYIGVMLHILINYVTLIAR